jgi:hypothetical protein
MKKTIDLILRERISPICWWTDAKDLLLTPSTIKKCNASRQNSINQYIIDGFNTHIELKNYSLGDHFMAIIYDTPFSFANKAVIVNAKKNGYTEAQINGGSIREFICRRYIEKLLNHKIEFSQVVYFNLIPFPSKRK